MRTPALALAVLALPLASLAQPAVPTPSTRELERINWMELAEFVPARSQTVLLPLGTLELNGVNGPVRALAVSGSDVFVGGSFYARRGSGGQWTGALGRQRWRKTIL